MVKSAYTIIIAQKIINVYFHMKIFYNNSISSCTSQPRAEQILSICSSLRKVQEFPQISHIVDGRIPVKAASSA